MKFDLHLHSEYSWDSKVKIAEYIKLAENNNFTAISITDHNNTESHALIDKYQGETDVLLIPGQEVSTSDGHLLVYGWVDQLPKNISMASTIKIAHNQSGLCIAAHPFDPFRGGSFSKIFETGIDGFELLNASAWFSFPNWLANRAYQKHRNLIGLGNSDSHRINEFGNAYSIKDAPRTQLPDSINRSSLTNLLTNLEPAGSRIGILPKLIRFFSRL